MQAPLVALLPGINDRARNFVPVRLARTESLRLVRDPVRNCGACCAMASAAQMTISEAAMASTPYCDDLYLS